MKLEPKTAARLVQEHDLYWDDMRPRLRKLKAAYETNYWDRTQEARGQIIIETSRAYEFIEGYIASLFSRNPSVVVKGDVRGRGNAMKAEALVNQFLLSIRSQVEDASRLALIFPCAFLKMSPVDHPDPFRRVRTTPVKPWDILVDDKADSWDDQRYIGHRYWVPLHKARALWGNKKYKAQAKSDYLDNDVPDGAGVTESESDDFDKFIQVVEFYDMVSDRLLVWSPNYADGKKWLFDGIDIDIEGSTEKIRRIPFRTADDHPIVPISPVYYSRLPDNPVRGYSALHRVYDQIQEVNISRTFQANAVRKASRQWLVEKGVIDSEAMAKISLGQDGEFIEVDLSPGQTLAGTVQPVPHTQTPPEIQHYIEQVQTDLDRGSVMAPFTRGQASSRATATEITALASYSHSEVGRLARERDGSIEAISRIYIAMMGLYLAEGKKDMIIMNGKTDVLSPKDLSGDFSYFAQDSGSTPMSEAQKKGELLGAISLLMELGVPADALRSEVVRLLDLPESFNEAMPAGPAGMPGQMPPGMPMPAPNQSPETMGLMPGGLPSPEQIASVLPS
jgi:hypothetical protein